MRALPCGLHDRERGKKLVRDLVRALVRTLMDKNLMRNRSRK